MKVVTMKLFIWASFLFHSQSVLLSVNEQTHLKIFIQHQFFGVGFKILRTLGVFNSSLSLLIWNIHQKIFVKDYLYNLRTNFTERFSYERRIFSAQFTSRKRNEVDNYNN